MKRKASVTIVVLSAAAFLIISAFALFPGLTGRGEKIILPSAPAVTDSQEYPSQNGTDPSEEMPAGGITAENVLKIIAVMKRSDNYNQRFRVSLGLKHAHTAEVWHLDGLIKVVFTNETETKNVVIGGETIYIWYDGDEDYYSGPLGGDFTADDELNIPTFENLLSPGGFQVVDARYETLGELDENCIFVETSCLDGLLERYWISTSTGLLVKFEAEKDGLIQYSMLQTFIRTPVTSDEEFAAAFTLPDGKPLT